MRRFGRYLATRLHWFVPLAIMALALVGWASELTVADIAELGARRISVGGALARAAWNGFIRAARLIAEAGRFDGFADLVTHAELGRVFRDDAARRKA